MKLRRIGVLLLCLCLFMPLARASETLPAAATREEVEAFIDFGLTDEEAYAEASRCLRCDHFGYGIFRGGRKGKW